MMGYYRFIVWSAMVDIFILNNLKLPNVLYIYSNFSIFRVKMASHSVHSFYCIEVIRDIFF